MMNAVDIILIILVGAAVISAIILIIRSRKRGNSCCGECSRCGKSGDCNEPR